jgi:hypothetical protein
MSTSTISTASTAFISGDSGDADDFWAPDSPDRRPVARIAVLLGCLALLGGLILVLVHRSLNPLHVAPAPLAAAAWAAFAGAAWQLRKVTGRLAVGLILAGGIALQAVAISAPPADSSDSYRYIWDGRVQAAGIDPYLYPPAAAGVAQLRTDFLWPPVPPARYHLCPHARVSKQGPAFDLVAGCAKLNRVGVPTIYPPVAEGYFLAIQLAAPADDSTVPIQAAGAACAMLTTLVLLLGLRRLGRDIRLAALWAWCPTVLLEAGNNAHVDVLAVLLTAISLLILARARTEGKAMLGGALLGLAIATKMTPVLVVPGVARRAWQHIAVAGGAAIVVVYAPHLMAVGGRVIGYLPGYLKEQGYSTGTGFDIIGLVAPGKLATVVAVVLLAAIALAILKFGDPGQPWRGGLLMTAAALVICTPEFQWYAMLLVMLIALDGRPEWLALPAGGYLANHAHLTPTVLIPHARVASYAAGGAIAGAIALIRYWRGAHPGGNQPPGLWGGTVRAVSLSPAGYAGRHAPSRPQRPGPGATADGSARRGERQRARTGADHGPGPENGSRAGSRERSEGTPPWQPDDTASNGGGLASEPTAGYERPIITIGADGAPAFGSSAGSQG